MKNSKRKATSSYHVVIEEARSIHIYLDARDATTAIREARAHVRDGSYPNDNASSPELTVVEAERVY